MSDGLERVAGLADIEPTVPLAVTLQDGTRLCLVRNGNEVHAVLDRCSHREFALSGGDVVAPCIIECPWHGAQFDARTGAVIRGPATDAIPTFSVRVEGEEVFVRS